MKSAISKMSLILARGGAQGLAELRSILAITERLSPEALLADQLHHLTRWLPVVAHAVPYHRPHLAKALARGEALSWQDFRELPIITRADVQRLGAELECKQPPAQFRAVSSSTTSGSTGRPLVSKGSHAGGLLAFALRLRLVEWHKLDPNRTAAFITAPTPPGTADPPDGALAKEPWAEPLGRGRSIALNLRADVGDQLAWLEKKAPSYLITYPSNLLALLKLSEERGVTLPALEAVSLSSEPVSDVLRDKCASQWKARCIATYSANETGMLALDAPGEDGYFVQSENVIVEVLHDDGRPCEPGEIGRVVVTTLHDVLRPLVRYEIGDYAEVGEPSPHGRPFPKLRRVVGRERTMVRLPDGRRVWPFFEFSPLVELHVIDQWQLVQKRDGSLVVRIVTKGPLSEADEARVRAVVLEAVPGLDVRVERVDTIPRTARGKYVEFVSEMEDSR
jgi:phenylacetate-CoA ligase